MPIQFYNTLSRKKETVESLDPPRIRMYTCGPTVYNFAHIGNFRAYVFEDLLRRHLKYRGFDVVQVMNLTDVEDKIIRTCRETGEPLKALTGRFAQAFFQDLDTLGIERAEHYPAATDHIPEMVALIQRLIANGHTYEAKGSIYFRLSSFPQYGRLSHFNLDELQSGASGRVDHDEYDREDARDFALWKAWDEEDGDVFWETELGKGRPGWHIECSAMSMKYLGESFDIHTGGIDNMFPHHENEIAQAEAATGKPFVKLWMHCAHLVVEGKKMSKSLGNFYTLRDLIDKGHDPKAIRWVLLATHYRQPNNFSFDALDAATQSLRRIQDFRLRLKDVRGEGSSLEQETAACEDAFGTALDDDLNSSGALAAVFDFVRETNKLIDNGTLGKDGAQRALALLDRLDAVTGLFGEAAGQTVPQDVLDRVQERQQARRNKDFARSDAIRDQLLQEGWVIEDTPDGPRVKKV
ncbi:MAG: cysteinyl-tRNA synthetase [Candidatus Hydrogenedentes bacterium]|nr:cysteinyl-tRNA synthetase [Candidatus Hydrogenedentota bacterium]